MSIIYQPPGTPFNPIYIDCLRNAVLRTDIDLTTNSTVFVPIATLILAPNLFDTIGKKLTIEMACDFLGVAGTKRFRFTLDGIVAYDTTAVGQNNQSTFTRFVLHRRTTNRLLCSAFTYMQPNGGVTPVVNLSSEITIGSLDFTIQKSLLLEGLVSNAADSLAFKSFSADVI